MLMAMGGVVGERWVTSLTNVPRRAVEAVFFAGVVGCGLYMSAIIFPVASGGPLMKFALENNGDLREEIGWDELVKTVAGIRDSLPAEQRQNLGVFVGNYGELGAIEILGAPYQLPVPFTRTNTAYLRGYPEPPPATLIVIGFSREGVDGMFTSCRLAGHNGNSLGVKNEESQDHPDIFVCGAPRLPWPEFWKEHQDFG
jgi:hypothetical protein